MASDYTGDSSEYNDTIELPTGGDARTVSSFRVPLEKLCDNSASNRKLVESTLMRQALAQRTMTVTLSDATNEAMGAVAIRGKEKFPGPVLVFKAGQAYEVHDHPIAPTRGGAIPDLTAVADAAVSASGQVVMVGSTTPFNVRMAFATGAYTANASLGAAGLRIVYLPATDGFIASKSGSADVMHTTTAGAAWAARATGLTAAVDLGVIGGGGGAGRIVVLGSNATPTFSRSTDNGATFALQAGSVPYAGIADDAGSLAGCPLITREGLRNYVYHCAVCDGGESLRFSRSADGETWEDGPILVPPDNFADFVFFGTPRLMICQTTGLMVVAVAGSAAVQSKVVAYASLNFTRWLGIATQRSLALGAFQVAGGRLLSTENAVLYASDGISHEVYTI